jgi:hypothetical protein
LDARQTNLKKRCVQGHGHKAHETEGSSEHQWRSV